MLNFFPNVALRWRHRRNVVRTGVTGVQVYDSGTGAESVSGSGSGSGSGNSTSGSAAAIPLATGTAGSSRDRANDLSELIDVSPLLSNQRAVASHIDDSYYTVRIPPGAFCPDALFPGALIDSTNSTFSAVRFADGANQSATASVLLPVYWRTGRISIDATYTANGASTSNFSVALALNVVAVTGNILTAATALYNGALAYANWPGPAADRGLKHFTAYTTVSIPGDAYLLGVVVRRDGAADANNNRLDLLGVTLVNIPSVQELHT